MKLHEALEQAGDQWFRPVAWRGKGRAYLVEDGWTLLVPFARSGAVNMTATVKLLTGEWEIVSPDVVCNECTRSDSRPAR